VDDTRDSPSRKAEWRGLIAETALRRGAGPSSTRARAVENLIRTGARVVVRRNRQDESSHRGHLGVWAGRLGDRQGAMSRQSKRWRPMRIWSVRPDESQGARDRRGAACGGIDYRRGRSHPQLRARGRAARGTLRRRALNRRIIGTPCLGARVWANRALLVCLNDVWWNRQNTSGHRRFRAPPPPCVVVCVALQFTHGTVRSRRALQPGGEVH